MRGAIVRSVLGDIPAESLGVCYAHEHIILDSSYATTRYPEFKLDSVEKAVPDLLEFKALGGCSMVDSMPCDAGRNVVKLAEVSRLSGVQIVCPTGLHLAKYYPEGHWGARLSSESLARLFIADIEEGIDANDYGGPEVERTGSRAGLIKIASGLNGIDEYEQRIFEGAAEAHLVTGVPILTHTEQGTAADKQLELLDRLGVNLRHVVISHTDRVPDLGYHKDILSSGVFVEYDSAFRWKSDAGNSTLELMVGLKDAGLLGLVMLGMDAARRSYWKSYDGAPGMGYLLDTFWPQLAERGFDDDDFRTVFVDSPRAAFSLCEVEG